MKKKFLLMNILILLLFGHRVVLSVTLKVPEEYLTIKAAIAIANFGDTVLVASGNYNTKSGEIFPLQMKSGICLKSKNGPDETVIYAGKTAGVISCEDVDSSAVIEGFTITGGNDYYGAGIKCDYSSPKIINNKIVGNYTPRDGGGIFISKSSPVVYNNWIIENTAVSNGGGIEIRYECNPKICANIISYNSTKEGDGGAINIWICSGEKSPIIKNNIIAFNVSNDKGGGISVYDPEGCSLISNNLII